MLIYFANQELACQNSHHSMSLSLKTSLYCINSFPECSTAVRTALLGAACHLAPSHTALVPAVRASTDSRTRRPLERTAAQSCVKFTFHIRHYNHIGNEHLLMLAPCTNLSAVAREGEVDPCDAVVVEDL